MFSHLLSSLDYSRYIFLYLAATESMLGIFSVQEDDSTWEHMIYYLSKGISSPKFYYSHVHKLYLVVVHDVQWFRNYILPREIILLEDTNPMQHILI